MVDDVSTDLPGGSRVVCNSFAAAAALVVTVVVESVFPVKLSLLKTLHGDTRYSSQNHQSSAFEGR